MKILWKLFTHCSVAAVALTFLLPSAANADISLLIEEAVGGAGEFTGSGHAAIYLSNVCAETPVKLRACKAGEEGVVIGAYPDWGPNAPFRWIAVPLSAFLYGVDRYEDVPIYANGKIRSLLRNTYRHNHLQSIAPDLPDGSKPDGRWEQMLVSAFNRDIYLMSVATTPEQDAKFILAMNSSKNVQDFSTTWHNCSDFAREIMNTYYPHAVHRDVANDFTMTTPKALAQSFTYYASHRPELLFSVTKYPQVSGPIRRSLDVRHFTEKGLISRKYYLSMLLTKPEVYAAFAVPYLLTGIYSIDKTYVKYPGEDVAQLNLQQARLKSHKPEPTQLASLKMMLVDDGSKDPKARLREIEMEREKARARLFGTEAQWQAYKKQFAPMLARAVETKLFRDEKEVQTFFKDLELQSTPAFDQRGLLMLNVDDHGTVRKLGITGKNVLADYSDPVLAYKLMLAKVHYQLNASQKNRDSMPAFEQDWGLLNKLARMAESDRQLHGDRDYQTPFRQNEEVVTGKKRFQKVMMEITH